MPPERCDDYSHGMDATRPDEGPSEALAAERGDEDKLWGSMIKQALKRRNPGFNESYYGYRSFNKLLEAARDQKVLALELDEKSGGYLVKALGSDS